LHNGAAESLAAVVSDVKHRTANGLVPDQLAATADQALVVKFLESIDFNTVPLVPLSVRRQGNDVFISFDSVAGVYYNIQAKDNLSDAWSGVATNAVGTGGRIELPVAIDRSTRFFRLTQGP